MTVALKTFTMAGLSAFAFICAPLAFPFVLITVFALWSLPFVFAGLKRR